VWSPPNPDQPLATQLKKPACLANVSRWARQYRRCWTPAVILHLDRLKPLALLLGAAISAAVEGQPRLDITTSVCKVMAEAKQFCSQDL